MKMTVIDARMSDVPIVPNPRPPCTFVFVRRSPIVAPNGRVRTNANQNKRVLEMVEKKVAKTTSASNPEMKSTPPPKPR